MKFVTLGRPGVRPDPPIIHIIVPNAQITLVDTRTLSWYILRMPAYYNEMDGFAAAWLRELIHDGLIAPGDVDERDIRDVRPDDLRGYAQCHFFAGIGGWSHALRLAGWPDDRPVWTGSCPCQSFSAAGKRTGMSDERHLWPIWFRLIRECRPATVFGENVSAAIRHGWLDLVQSDLEATGYAVGKIVLGAHSAGAPHIRQRVWFAAHTERDPRGAGWTPVKPAEGAGTAREWSYAESGRCSHAGELGHSHPAGPQGRSVSRTTGIGQGEGGCSPRSSSLDVEQSTSEQVGLSRRARESGTACDGLAHSSGERRTGQRVCIRPEEGRREQGDLLETSGGGETGKLALADGGDSGSEGLQRGGEYGQQPTDGGVGFWSDYEWLPCIDGKSRPTQPGIFPLAHGVPNRVGTLRGAGNAIVPQVAAAFIQSYIEVIRNQ